MTEAGRPSAHIATSGSAAAVEWLLASDEPAVTYLTRRDVLGEDIEPDAETILAGPIVRHSQLDE